MNLKRIISIVTTLCMLTMSLIPGVIYAADAIDAIKATTAEVYDDLEGYTDVPVGSDISNLDGWSMSHTVTGKSGTLAKLKTATNPDNLCVKYNTDGASYTTQGHITYAYYDFEAVSNDYILVSAKMNFNKQDRWIFLVNGEPSKNGEITTNNKNAVVELMIESGGKLCCEIRGNNPTWTEINTNTDNWTAGIWNDINILINSKAMTFDVYTNGVKRNSAPIPLSKTYVSNVGDRLGCVNRLSFGVMRQSNWGEMYVDDVTVNGLSEAELVAFDQTGLVVPDVITADTKLTASTPTFKFPINWTTDNANVQVGSDGTVVANSVANGKTVTLTAKVGDVTLGTYTATVNVETAIDTLFYEPFSYTLGQSISQTAAAANGWGVLAEDVIPAGQGSTSLVMQDPSDSTNSVLDVETLTVPYTGTNRYAYVKGPFDANGRKYIMINTKVNITTNGNAYVFYINGDYKNSSTDAVTGTNRTMLQFTYDMPNGVLSHQDSSAYKTLSSTGLALNKWTDMKFVIDTAAQTYNVYMDDVKLTQSPVALFSNYPGEYVSGINTITIGSNRWHRTSGHCYTDDLTVTAFDDAGVVEFDLEKVTVPATANGDFDLPNSGLIGSAFTWASGNTDIITVQDGKAVVNVPDNNTEVTLTLTAASGEASDSKVFTVMVLGDKDRIDNMNNKLTSYVLSGQKYVMESFTPNIPGLKADDTLEITCEDSCVAYDGSKVTITQGTEDKIVDVKVKVTSKKGNSFEKTLKLYIASSAIVGMYEDFDYPSLEGSSVSGADSWSVTAEDANLATTGAALYVEKSPDDETDLVLDTNVIRQRDPKQYSNQYATWNGTATLAGDAILQANIKFDNNVGNQYIWYNQGTVKTSSGESTKTLIQLFMNRSSGTLQSQLADGVATISSTPLPTNEWFNMKVVVHATENNFDVYINNVLQNAEPIPFYQQTEGGVVTAITQVQFGASRYTGIPGHMYVDDIMVRSNPADILATEAKVISIPSTLVYDFELPTEGIYEGTTISWKSSKPEVLSDKGVVTRQIGFGSTDVTLTATIKSGEAKLEKDIVVKVVNAPYYTIDNVTFETSDGNVSYVPVNGGKLKNISVTKYTSATDDNATAFIAVYAKDGRLLKVYEPKAVTASGNITYDEQLPIEDGMYAKAFIWNKSTYAPLAYSYSTKIEGEATIYTIGDSTMQTYATNEIRQQDNNITGWAQVLSLAADGDVVTIDNHAVSGTSTRCFTNWGYIHPVYDGLKQGDYLVIQFGHNDEKPWDSQMAYDKYAPLEEEHWLESTPEVPEKYKDYKTYEQWLREYAAAARMKGAHVVFATSIYRRQFDGETPVNGHCGYPEAMIATAQELNAPVLDLHARTGEWLTKVGFDGSLKYFLAFHGGTDNTHLTYDGAVEVANLAIGEMNRIGLPLAQYFDEVPAR